MGILDGDRFAELAREHGIPGATMAIWADGSLTELAAGVLNLGTGVETTTDSLFQIGSITKLYTATLVMRLVEQGLATVDTPVAELLPDFRLATPEATATVTLRHLLTHTSGIDGDFFHDTGRGDDCVEKYVRDMADIPPTHPVGATLSYCNAGYVLLGRVIERLTGLGWDTVLRKHLAEPLGADRTWTLPEDALRFRTALGHVADGDEPVRPAPQWGLMRSVGPAGLICASAADVVAFARLHLDGGVTADGTRLLDAALATEMAGPQVRVPHPHGAADHWGLGWMVYDWAGRRVIGHDGSTIGQSASLRLVPDAGVAVAILTNTGTSHRFRDDVLRDVLGELCHVSMPAPLGPPDEPPTVDAARHTGTYGRTNMLYELSVVDGRLLASITRRGELSSLQPVWTGVELIPLSEDEFVAKPPGFSQWVSYHFYTLPDGSTFMHNGTRANPYVH